ncbi:hypothetical protein C8R48DRAFT_224321 [Suillus tomentosus]|nr:hypothetical protein C8R48DRAFT_224321 [Suillus tomentosus]
MLIRFQSSAAKLKIIRQKNILGYSNWSYMAALSRGHHDAERSISPFADHSSQPYQASHVGPLSESRPPIIKTPLVTRAKRELQLDSCTIDYRFIFRYIFHEAGNHRSF